MTKTDAEENPSIKDYMKKHFGLLKIDLSNEIFTSADITESRDWKEGIVIKKGSLFENEQGKLFICLEKIHYHQIHHIHQIGLNLHQERRDRIYQTNLSNFFLSILAIQIPF